MKKKLFSRAGLALAIGASLMVLAGIAQAAAPAFRAANPAVVSATGVISDANTRALLSTTGLSGQSITVSVNLTSAVTTAGIVGDIQATVFGTPLVLVTALTVNNATLTTNNVNVYTGTLGASTVLPVTSATLVPDGTNVTGTASINVILTAPVAPAAYRVLAGNLQFTSNNGSTGGTAVAFAAVNFDVQSATAAPGAIIYTEVDGVAGFITPTDAPILTPLTIAGTVKNSLAPTPTINTASAVGGVLVNGFVVDTATPITLTAANLSIATVATGIGGMVGGTTFAAAAVAAPVCAAGLCTETFPGLGTLATAADLVAPTGVDAADVTAYNSTNFNTGINGVTVPFSVDGTTTHAAYTEVFAVSDGAAATLAPAVGAAVGAETIAARFPAIGTSPITDGAQIVVVSAQTSNATAPVEDLTLTFSEPVVLVGTAAGALREVTENVLIGTDSLAALNLNAGGTLSLTLNAASNGQQSLTISGVQIADVSGNTVSVTSGIALRESNDTGFSATVPALDTAAGTGPNGVDLAGGLWATTGNTPSLRTPSTTTALAVGLAPVTIVFGTNNVPVDTTAVAFPTVADPTKIGTIVVTFATGKEVALGGTHTLADLAAQLVVTVNGIVGSTIAPRQFQFHPTAAQLALNTAGSQLTITLPTTLIYANIDVVQKVDVEYLAAGVTGSVLVDKATGLIAVTQAAVGALPAGTQVVQLPLTAVATSDTLITQSIIGTLTSTVDPNGSRVKAYLAKWVDRPTKPNTQNITSLLSGNVVNANDRVGTTLALEFIDGGPLQTAIQKMMNSATAAAPAVPGVSVAVPAVAATPTTVYVKLIRSNDPTANGQGASTGNQVYLEGRALMASTYAAAKAATGAGQTSGDNLDPIYEVSLSAPNIFLQPAGNTEGRANVAITGRLTGNIVVTFNTSTNPGGLEFIGQNGRLFTSAAGAGPVGQAIIGTVNATPNSYNLLLGIDPGNPTDIGGTNTIGGPGGGFPDTNLTPGTNFGAITSANAFVLLVHEQPTSGLSTFTMLTSADPTAANFMPFKPNLLTGLGTRTPLLTSVLANIKHLTVVPSNNWALYGEGSPARAAVPAGQTWTFPRGFVGIDATGTPKSFWNNDGSQGDMAMTMAANKILVATEIQPQGTTLSTIVSPVGVNGSVAFAWADDNGGAVGDELDILQSTTAVTPKVGIGWSLVTVPTGGVFNTTTVNAIIRVGAQLDAAGTPQQTWIQATDGAAPTLTAGEAVFVFSKLGGNL